MGRRLRAGSAAAKADVLPEVSVLMTTYNHERTIAQAVQSVAAQQVDFPLELVVGEDCSTDGTRAILLELAAQYPDLVRLRLRPTNWGRRRNWVDVLQACQGRYVAVLEGDDYWISPHKLQRQVDFMRANPTCAICFHAVWTVDETQGGKRWEFRPNPLQARYTLADLCRRNFIATGAVLFRNHLYAPLPDWYATIPAGDWPLHVLNARHGDIGYLDDLMGVHRIHSGGVWSARQTAQRLDDKIAVAVTLRDFLAPAYQELWNLTLATFAWQKAWALARSEPIGALRAVGQLLTRRDIPWRVKWQAGRQGWQGRRMV